MARSKMIRVTPNVKACLEELKVAVKSIPSRSSKKRAMDAISYLEKTFKGKPQPKRGLYCPGGAIFIRP
jgi:hypothetical protein